MFANIFKVSWRNLLRNKTFSMINMIGLATGLACFLLIALYVMDELSYDRYNKNANRIYRIHSSLNMGGSELKLAVTSDPMGASLKKDYPQIKQYTRLYTSRGSKLIRKGNQFINENRVGHADSTFFSVFTLPSVSGNSRLALNEPNTVVVTESAAKKYFGTTDVLGRTIETDDNNRTLYKIMAVIKDIPLNSHFNFDFIFSMDNVDYGFGNYLSHNFHTYLLLKEGADYKDLEKKFPEFIDRYILPQARQVMDISSMEDFKKSGNDLSYSLMPLTDIHLHSDLMPELGVNGDIQYVYIFSAVALFILLLACINFINLSTARSVSRAKEVGIRKVLGTNRHYLIGQFLAESAVTVFLSLVISLLIVWLVLPYFNDLAGKSFTTGLFLNEKMIAVLIALPLMVTLLAGSYPAFVLSSFQPVSVLKGKIFSGTGKSTLRSGLVIFQFATSIILIIATIIVFRQLDFIQTRKIGFNKDQVLIIDGTGSLGSNTDAFRNEVTKLPGVISSTYSGFLPVSSSSRTDNTFSKEAVLNPQNSLNMQNWTIDENYIPALGMEIISGRNFSKQFGTDSSAVIINETAASLLGFGDPVGKKLYTLVNTSSNQVVTYYIIGVVKNFNYESLKQNVGPLCFTLGSSSWSTAFRIKPGNAKALIQQAESKWKAMAPGMPFSYRFLDEAFENMYYAEQRVGKIAFSFAVLAVIIASLGLFGLATYMAEQRTKEIGVRKVLGATVNNIVTMLSRDFLKLVFIASLIAFPLSWMAMNNWLQDFQYRIDIGWVTFVLAGVFALFIALFTVSFQAVKAALANPVKSLRTE